jgi:hypothetical protein
MVRYAFRIEIEAESEPLDVPMLCPDSATARRRASELLTKYPPFRGITILWEGQPLCRLDRGRTD